MDFRNDLTLFDTRTCEIVTKPNVSHEKKYVYIIQKGKKIITT